MIPLHAHQMPTLCNHWPTLIKEKLVGPRCQDVGKNPPRYIYGLVCLLSSYLLIGDYLLGKGSVVGERKYTRA